MADPPRPDPRALLQEALAAGTDRPAPWPAPAPEVLAPHFPELTIVGLIGQGGMAAVYRAVQDRLGRTVALKVLRPELAQQPEFAQRFLREARALAGLANAHVLTVHDFGERGGFCWLLTEYVDGANLRELMALGRLSPAEVLRIVPQICAGLQFAHEHGVVHRDIKPENVLVDRHGQVKLADFGLAKLAHAEGEATLTRTSMVFGTPQYMAPEQWRGSASVDHRADIYSLGVVLYELLTGKLPVGAYAPPSQSEGVPKGIDEVVHRTLEPEPERRYQSAGEVRRDVEQQALDPAAPVAAARVPAAGAVRAPRLAPGHWLLLLAAAVLLGSMLGISKFANDELDRHRARVYVAAEREHLEAQVEAIRTSVEQGKPWTGALPVPLSVYQTRTLDRRWILWCSLGWGLGALACGSLLGVAAGRRLRAAAAGFGARFCAAVLAWLPLPVLFDAAVVAASEWHSDLGAVVGLTAIVASNSALAIWLWRRTSATAAAPPPARHWSRAAFAAGLAACALLLLGSAIAGSALPREPALRNVVARPVRAGELHGCTPGEVVAWLGPPLAIELKDRRMLWAYFDVQARRIGAALQFEDGRVAWAEDQNTNLVPGRRPPRGPYLGQDTFSLLADLGAAGIEHVGVTEVLDFADGTRVAMFANVVIAILK